MDLESFARLSTEDARAWLLARQAEAQERRVAECAANRMHVMASRESACPLCGTPYAEVDHG